MMLASIHFIKKYFHSEISFRHATSGFLLFLFLSASSIRTFWYFIYFMLTRWWYTWWHTTYFIESRTRFKWFARRVKSFYNNELKPPRLIYSNKAFTKFLILILYSPKMMHFDIERWHFLDRDIFIIMNWQYSRDIKSTDIELAFRLHIFSFGDFGFS